MKMTLADHYTTLYKDALQKIKTDTYSLDALIDFLPDNRRGVTLLIRPDAIIKNNIQKFINKLKEVAPEQYYHPLSDMHVTVMSIISCYDGFDLNNISVPDYIRVIEKSIKASHIFALHFKGVTLSPSCVMVQGFFNDTTLNNIRDSLRTNFKDSGLQQSMDMRYTIRAAHITVVRFRQSFTKKDAFLKIIERYREHDFGTQTTGTLEFVYNDWYQRKEFVKKLHKFHLKK